MMAVHTRYNAHELAQFCRKWQVQELALFGSVLHDEFRPESDIDVLVTFDTNARWSLWDWPVMTQELEAIFGRSVDLVEKKALHNPFRRHHIMKNHEVVYAA